VAGRLTLCDPIWQVTSRSSEMGFPWRAIWAFTFYHFPISHARSHVAAPKLVPSPSPPPKKSNEHRFSGYHFTICIVNVSNCLTWVSGSVGAVFISLTFYGHDNVPNNESVFVGISESRPHCTDRISRDPHTRCAVTSSVTWRRQLHRLRELRYERPKKSIECVEMSALIFAVCGPKFTKFGTHVGEWLQFPTPFSDRRYLVPIWRYSRSNREFRNFDVFGPPNFLGEGAPKFLTHI